MAGIFCPKQKGECMHFNKRRASGLGGKSAKAQKDKQLRDQRELARELHERVRRQAIPQRDDGPLPRID
nr:hypothetical protein [uncultured Acidovorax sp.]